MTPNEVLHEIERGCTNKRGTCVFRIDGVLEAFSVKSRRAKEAFKHNATDLIGVYDWNVNPEWVREDLEMMI